jgi:Uma2 family endonuclease
MTVMTSAAFGPPPASRGPFTRADLDAMPNDGRRYELIDGVLIVSPLPRPLHQMAVRNLTFTLEAARPSPEYELLFAPLDVALDDQNVVQPDVLVARSADLSDRDLPTAPLLAVEIMSPSTRRFDLLLKRSWHKDAGTLAYWIIDPEAPSLRAWELRDGRYLETAHVTGEERFSTEAPFTVAFAPADLIGDRKFRR